MFLNHKKYLDCDIFAYCLLDCDSLRVFLLEYHIPFDSGDPLLQNVLNALVWLQKDQS